MNDIYTTFKINAIIEYNKRGRSVCYVCRVLCGLQIAFLGTQHYELGRRGDRCDVNERNSAWDELLHRDGARSSSLR